MERLDEDVVSRKYSSWNNSTGCNDLLLCSGCYSNAKTKGVAENAALQSILIIRLPCVQLDVSAKITHHGLVIRDINDNKQGSKSSIAIITF